MVINFLVVPTNYYDLFISTERLLLSRYLEKINFVLKGVTGTVKENYWFLIW